MKLAYLTASSAVLLLSSTALMAQSEPAQTLENVYIDVGGMAVQVPIAQAAEACALDEASLQQIAQTRLSESGLDPAVVYGLGNENPDAMASTDTAAADTGAMDSADTTTEDTAAAEELGEMGGADATATDAADAGATAGAATNATGAASDDMASADASGTMESGTGSDMAAADTSGTVDSTAGTTGGTDTTATADASGAADTSGDMASDVQNVEPTAADTSATGADPMLQLAVCQVDQARATELGIYIGGAGSMGSTGAATE